jgi:hypothetical protein
VYPESPWGRLTSKGPMNDDEFLAAFEGCTLPRAEWTHAAHIRMAWFYLTRLPFETALDHVRAGIRRYNASVGSDGYHETLTVAFTLLIRSRLATAGPRDGFLAFRAGNPDLFHGRSELLQRYYEPATLASAEARQRFVEPDREALPQTPAARDPHKMNGEAAVEG